MKSIGSKARDGRRGDALKRKEWKRLALAIEDYRERHAITDPVLPLGEASWADPARETLARSIAGFRKDRGLGLGFEL